MATPCPARFSQNPMTRKAAWLNVWPSGPTTTAALASSSVIQAGLLIRWVTCGVISAAQA
jgi:hypothetical protein